MSLTIPLLKIGSHVHSVVGASRFKDVYDPDDLMKSNCTTIPIQLDKSNYWAVCASENPCRDYVTEISIASIVPPEQANRRVHPNPYVCHFRSWIYSAILHTSMHSCRAAV